MLKNVILIKNGFLPSVLIKNTSNKQLASKDSIGTILSNLIYFNYIPSKYSLETMLTMSEEELICFWNQIDDGLKSIFKNFNNAKNGVVYKNFPMEVLDKTESEYWFAQSLMYLGLPSEVFAQKECLRDETEKTLISAKVLQLAEENTLNLIFKKYLNKKTKYTPEEESFVEELVKELDINSINISDTPFKHNGVFVANVVNNKSGSVFVNNLTDLFRFAAFLSGEKDLNKRITFFKFNRKQRKQILKLFLTLNLNNFDGDVAQRRESFKALFKALRAGDYKWARPVSELYDRLYNNKVKSVNSLAFSNGVNFDVLMKNKGVFMRNFHYAYKQEPELATQSMLKTLSGFDVLQLLKFKRYLQFSNTISKFVVKPNSSFKNAKLIENKKAEINISDKELLLEKINSVLKEKLAVHFPNGVLKGEGLENIKLKSNDQEIELGRGTRVKLPEGTNFIRSASMWENKSNSSVWFDNGWNFIHNGECKANSVCWTNERTEYACFSGDPVTGFNGNQIGTQLIDIDIQEMKKKNIKYAVWNILCYSNIPFSEADKVYACAQFLNDQNKGQLFEPKNLDIQFEVKGRELNKFVLVLDVNNDEIIYLDQAFPNVSKYSAENNEEKVLNFLPAMLENIDLIPSVGDLVENINDGDTPFLMNDKEFDIKGGKAYVFNSINENNNFDKIDLNTILNS